MVSKILNIPIFIATILTYAMSNASQNIPQPLAIMDAKGKKPITMLHFCSIPHLAAKSGFIKSYFNFYEQNSDTKSSDVMNTTRKYSRS